MRLFPQIASGNKHPLAMTEGATCWVDADQRVKAVMKVVMWHIVACLGIL